MNRLAARKTSPRLDEVYLEIKQLLKKHARPFRLVDAGVRGKHSAQLIVPKPVAIPGAYGGKPVNLQFAAAIL